VDVTTFFNPACTSIVTHADGTLVSADSPAKSGETVVVYAFGLGQTTPAVKTGGSNAYSRSGSPLGQPVL
jgi:uncharacterized protein (TIGR03437 family)